MMAVYRWRDLERWDAFTIPRLHIAPHLPQRKIADLLTPRHDRVDRGDWAFDRLQPITIHFGGDISRRKLAEGTDYSLSLFWAKPGDLVLSKIDLKNGAVGVVPAGWDNVVVTSHFKVYVPDTARLDPRFFRLLLQTREFKAWLWANRSGADGRTEVKLNVFEALEIPLPPLAEQTALCNAYNDALTRAVLLEQEAKAIEDAGLRVFEDALGMATPPPVPDRPLVIARFRDMDRWTPEAVLASGCGHTPGPPRFPTAKLRALIAGIEVGWSPKCLERSASEEEWGVLKLSAITTGTFDPTANKALSPKFAPRPGIEVKAGDVLITRGSGIARLVGATVLVGSAVRSRLMVCDLIFRVRFLGDTPIVPGYLVRVLRTTDLRRQIEERRTGAPPMMQKITKSALLDLDVPIPDIGTQRAFVRGLEKTAIAAGEKRTEAATLRQSAWSAFEAALFGPAT